MTNDLIYVYCISNCPCQPVPEMGPKGLKSIMFDDFYVFVKYVSESEFSEENLKKNLSDIQWVETNVRDHIKVISMIMESGPVIPFKFGTIYNTKAGLQRFIADYSDSLIGNFHNITGKEEWAVKIYCNRKALSNQIDELSEAAAALEEQSWQARQGKHFFYKEKKQTLSKMRWTGFVR